MANIRGTHSSPGVYSQIVDLSYAAESLGITKLGLVGETLKGPAFEPVDIHSWPEFVEVFGGTNPQKFKDSKYPKYELPYIAKSYLSASEQLKVCRVLGLSGYNAGPAFALLAYNENNVNKKHVFAVLRSRGAHTAYGNNISICDKDAATDYDKVIFLCKDVKLEPYKGSKKETICDGTIDGESATAITLNSSTYARFTITCTLDDNSGTTVSQSVSLDPSAKDYIYKVIGSDPMDGSLFPVYVEELFDMDLENKVAKDIVNVIDDDTAKFEPIIINAVTDPVSDFVYIPHNELSKRLLGRTYLAIENMSADNGYVYYPSGSTESQNPPCILEGDIVKVVYGVYGSGNTKGYYYTLVTKLPHRSPSTNEGIVDAVKVLSDGRFYAAYDTADKFKVKPVVNFGDYRESFRCATTPWIVSEAKGDGKNIEVKKLFRLHTISDGNAANSQIKIAISNIRPDEGRFDLFIRDFNDTDRSPVILESYRNLTMEPGDPNYIGLRIGTLNGEYETESKYVLAEVVENNMTSVCVPCGFLGYPTRDYGSLIAPSFVYNTNYNQETKVAYQYFGLGDIDGASSVDVDMLNYKGVDAYTENYLTGYTNSFHLDYTVGMEDVNVTVDGDDETLGMKWTTVNPQFDPREYGDGPIIGSEEEMASCIYRDKGLRKFVVYPYGGFDGWDVYRGSRSNTDEFKWNTYKGVIKNNHGEVFSVVENPSALALPSKAINSDYYAYLAGANQFEIPEKTEINLFATPGIDYVNNTLLCDEIIDMITTKRGDTLYVPTTPDKPFGASDSRDEMYTSAEAVENLEIAGIDTYYAATYYPWVKYYDNDNSVYINLPATKDALRNMADVDNKKYPWYTPAGIERGNVECKNMHFFAKIEDEDTVYDGRINPLKTFSEDGVKIWGNKTMYDGDTPMNRINVVRMVLYMRNLITKASNSLIFDPNDTTLKDQFEGIINPILSQIKSNRGIYDYQVKVSQTVAQMDAHEISANIYVKPTPVLEYIELTFTVSPLGVSWYE